MRFAAERRTRDLRNRGRAKFGEARERLLASKFCDAIGRPNRAYEVILEKHEPAKIPRIGVSHRDPDFLIAWALNGRELPPGVTLDELACLLAVSGYAGVEARIAEALEIAI